jgi:hypothetical protein
MLREKMSVTFHILVDLDTCEVYLGGLEIRRLTS